MDYQNKVISVEKALSLVKDDFCVATGLGAAEARLFMSKLHTIADRVKNVSVVNCLPMVDHDFLKEEYKKSFSVEAYFYTPTLRKNHKNGNISYIPNHLHLAATDRLVYQKPNIYVGLASMPDKYGFVSLSVSNTYEMRFIKESDIVILEINPNAPRTFGDAWININEVDFLVEANYDLPEIPESQSNEKDRAIGKTIAQYVQDGDCLQLGIGGIPNAVAESLMDKKDLGIHTEMITTGMMKLAKAGVITGKNKQVDVGKLVATFALGTTELYEYLDDNPSIVLRDGASVNDPHVIGLNDNQVSINTTLEVDLTGQCCSEAIGSVQFSGTGGQTDTAVGAQNSKNGRSFIALYSTAMVKNPQTGEREETSKIVCQLKAGAAVSLCRNDLDYLVTEYGIVRLKGVPINKRAQLIISIAHPKFRDQLKKQAVELGLMAGE